MHIVTHIMAAATSRMYNIVYTYIYYIAGIPYKWLFSRVVYFTNGPSFFISQILISRMGAIDNSIYFTNL